MPPLTQFNLLSFLALAFTIPAVAVASPLTFSNPNPIVISDSPNPPTIATPYPSSITVTGLTASVITKLTVQLNNFAHAFPDDVDIVLVGPEGQNSVVMSNVGGGHPGATNITLILDDDAASSLPLSGPLVSGTFKPTKRLSPFGFTFPSPAPPTPGPAAFSVFNGTEPNGTWNLFVVDDTNPDSGIITGGWALSLTTTPVLLSIAPVGNDVVLAWTNAATGYSLQTTTTLSASNSWTNALPSPVVVSGRYTVTNAATGPTRFYRLIK